MESTYMAQQSAGRAAKLYAGQDVTPSYQIQPGIGASGTHLLILLKGNARASSV